MEGVALGITLFKYPWQIGPAPFPLLRISLAISHVRQGKDETTWEIKTWK